MSNNIVINPLKTSTIEFEVIIQGSDIVIPKVRLVALSASDECSYLFACERKDKEKNIWEAKIPALLHVKDSTMPFCIEVILDDYIFIPAEGTLTLVSVGDVKTEVPAIKNVALVQESEITGQYAPTNNLLKPEEEPKQSSVKAMDIQKDDELVDKTQLSDLGSSFTPGEETDKPTDIVSYDPKQVAEEIVKNMVGSVKKPEKPGTLFSRKNGKVVVDGLDSPDDLATKHERAKRVRQILNK